MAVWCSYELFVQLRVPCYVDALLVVWGEHYEARLG